MSTSLISHISKAPRRMTVILATLAALAAMGLAPSASAQFAFGGDEPIEVDADRIEYDGNLTVLTGQVQVVQADVRILADTINLYRAELGDGRLGDVTRIDAIGNFYYITPREKVHGEQGVYEQDKDRITVTGDVILEDAAGNIGTGNRLVYNLTSKEALLQGDCEGRAACNSRASAVIANNGSSQ